MQLSFWRDANDVENESGLGTTFYNMGIKKWSDVAKMGRTFCSSSNVKIGYRSRETVNIVSFTNSPSVFRTVIYIGIAVIISCSLLKDVRIIEII